MRPSQSRLRIILAAAMFLGAMLTANTGQAHNGARHEPASAVAATMPVGEIADSAQAIVSVAADRDAGDAGCDHGPLHLFCMAGASSCMTSGDDVAQPLASCRHIAGGWRTTPVAGLAPPPLDRPPR